MIKRNSLFKNCLISTGLTWAVNAAVLPITALICLASDDPMGLVWLARAVLAVSGAVCGIICGRLNGKNGLLCGICCVGAYILPMAIPSALLGDGSGFIVPAVICAVTCVVFACVGASLFARSGGITPQGRLPKHKKVKNRLLPQRFE